MLFMREDSEPRHLWVNRGVDGRWDYFESCDACDTLSGRVTESGETWNEPGLCPSCIVCLSFESPRQDHRGMHPCCPLPGEFQQDDPALLGLERKPEDVGLRPMKRVCGLRGDAQDARCVKEGLREACRDRDSKAHLTLMMVSMARLRTSGPVIGVIRGPNERAIG